MVFVRNYLFVLMTIITVLHSKEPEINSWELYQRGVHAQYEIGDLAAALNAYHAALDSITLRDEGIADYLGMYNDMGVIYLNMKDFKNARWAFENVLQHDPTNLNALSNFASLQASLGNNEAAEDLYRRGFLGKKISVHFLHNYAVHMINTQKDLEGIALFELVLQHNAEFYHSRNEIAKYLCKQDKLNISYSHYEKAMLHAAAANDESSFWQIYFTYIISSPMIFPTCEFLESFRSLYISNLYEALTLMPKNAVSRPEVNLGCSCLGYYLIYQGYSDIIPRQLFSSLIMHVSGDAIRPSKDLPFYSDQNDEYLGILNVRNNTKEMNAQHSHKKRVGFLGSFCNQGSVNHSVTVLTRGLIEHLNASVFDIVVISVWGEVPFTECAKNYFFSDLLMLPRVHSNSNEALQQIQNMALDILIFTEIGMNHDIYFLAQSRLAKRTLSFWGHAITSGIIDIPILSESLANKHIAEFDDFIRGGPDYFVSSVLFERKLVDGFNSQLKYSERLLLQEGLTTYFYHPPLPLEWRELGETFPESTIYRIQFPRLPGKMTFLARYMSHEAEYDKNYQHLEHIFLKYSIRRDNDFALYCIPQTLYKLSPQNIDAIKQLLARHVQSILVLLDGEVPHPSQKALLLQGLPSFVLDRVVFLKKLSQREYVTLLAISDVVLDTFPVGGGRSSFAIFSTGTPIVLLYPETSILQLTFGMYKAMGISCSQCINDHVDDFISGSISIASNKTLQRLLRKDIFENKKRLFENASVIEEWEHMLHYILSIPRPLPFSDSSRLLNSEQLTLYQMTQEGTKHAHFNYRKDIQRIYNSTQSQYSLQEWAKRQSLSVSLALSLPYTLPPIRLMLVRERSTETSYTSKSTQNEEIEPLDEESVDEKPLTVSNKVCEFDRQGVSLGLVLSKRHVYFKGQSRMSLLHEVVESLRKALHVDIESDFSAVNIQEVFVIEDGTLRYSAKERSILSQAYPTFHFIFGSLKPKQHPQSIFFKGMNGIFKLAQYRYLLIMPSAATLKLPNQMTSQLRQAYHDSNCVSQHTFLLNLAKNILNGFSPAMNSERFGLNMETGRQVKSDSNKVRQAAHIVLLRAPYYLAAADGNCSSPQTEQGLKSDLAGFESLIAVNKCSDCSESRQRSLNEDHNTFGGSYCARNASLVSFINDTVAFGGFVNEDIRYICRRMERADDSLQQFEKRMKKDFQDKTCLAVLLDEADNKHLSLLQTEKSYLRDINEFFSIPSLWDIDAVSYVIQGLEREFVINSTSARKTAPSVQQMRDSRSLYSNQHRKLILLNYSRMMFVCPYIDVDSSTHCNTLEKSFSFGFLLKALSAGVRVAYLYAN